MEEIYIVTGESESGDYYGPWAFRNEPTEDELKKLITWCDGTTEEDWDFEGGGTTFNSYISLHLGREHIHETLTDFLEAC